MRITQKCTLEKILAPAIAIAIVVSSSLAYAGGHNKPAKPREVLNFDPKERAEETGTVLVSGSNRGIGLAMVRNYAERGWNVIATARKPEKADDLNALVEQYPDQIRVEQMDLLDHASIDALAENLKDVPIDILLNNAAFMGEPNEQVIGNYNYELAERVHAINVIGTLKMIEALLPNVAASSMKKSRWY